MARIKVTPEEVHQVASQFKQASSQSQEMVQRLQQTMGNLQPNWEGMTQQRFYGEYEQWRNSMNQFVQLLGQIAQQLDAIADRFAQADQA
jgi:WXG100 family type VII secretion target